MDAFALETSAFDNAQAIPSRHTCEGEDVSPPLRWTNVEEKPGELGRVDRVIAHGARMVGAPPTRPLYRTQA